MFCGGAAELGVDFYLLSARKARGGRAKAEQQQPSVKENILVVDGTGCWSKKNLTSRLLGPRIGWKIFVPDTEKDDCSCGE